MDALDTLEAVHTLRAVRRFRQDPVPEEALRQVLDAAICAPSGANRQPWAFVIIREPDLKRQVASYYRRSWEQAYGGAAAAPRPADPRVRASAAYLAEHMAEVPVLVLACIHMEGGPATFTHGASIYPAVQNLMLAARALGLGTALTTLHKRYEAEVKGLLGIPADWETAALIPLGFPAGRSPFGLPRRRPVAEVTFADRWENPAWPAQ
ncbi:MAG: nitroreductase family protein [Chloroflexi bacterium]|nr:nitroreductase family protein [Chloroflexota bacterium]